MIHSSAMPAPASQSHTVSSLLTHNFPHPSINRPNLWPPHSSNPLPTSQLPPPPTILPSHHHPPHNSQVISSTHRYTQPQFSSPPLRPPAPPPHHPPHPAHASPQPIASQPTGHYIPTFPSVPSSQSSLLRQLCNPVTDQVPNHPRPVHLSQQRYQSTDDHPKPDLLQQPTKYRRLDHASQVSPANRPLLSVINNQYDTASPRDDGYSTGSRETAPVGDSLEEDEEHDIEAPYTCVHCAARFSDREQRKHHVKIAHEKPFVCTVCNSRFTRKFDLEKHSLTVHEGMRPFQCDICNARFGQKHHLVRHKRAVHAKARDFACDTCDSKFARKEHLGNHKRAVHEKHKPYMCSLCDLQYYERRALRRHLEQVHSVKSSRAPVLVEWQPNSARSAPSISELVQM